MDHGQNLWHTFGDCGSIFKVTAGLEILHVTPWYSQYFQKDCLFFYGQLVGNLFKNFILSKMADQGLYLLLNLTSHRVIKFSKAFIAQQFWHVDHIIPVTEGGGECDIDNLRTLCTVCHRGVTAQQNRDRRQRSKLKAAAGCGDIAAFFQPRWTRNSHELCSTIEH